MRSGKSFCIDIDKSTPDFAEYQHDGTFTQNFFDWEWLNTEANYIQYVRENENHSIGGLNQFVRNEAFTGIIRSGAANEEELSNQIAKIPNFST